MIIARQSTARTITIGPVLDATGVAVTNGVVGDFKIAKNGAAPAALNASATLTHRHTGFYSLALTASDLDTVGQAEITIDDTTNACGMKEITVVEEVVYDALFVAGATGLLPANVTQFGGTAGTFAAGIPAASLTAAERLSIADSTWLHASAVALASAVAAVGVIVTAIATNVSTLLTRIPAALFSGITSLGDWLRRGFRKDAGSAGMIAAQSEINTGGTATFDGTTDALEAIRDAESIAAPTLDQIAARIITDHGTGSYVATAGQMQGAAVPSFRDVSFTYMDLSLKTIQVVDANGDAVELPDPDDETLTLAIETMDNGDVYTRSTDDVVDPIVIDPDAGTITMTPDGTLVSLEMVGKRLQISLRGANNRPVASGSGVVSYLAFEGSSP